MNDTEVNGAYHPSPWNKGKLALDSKLRGCDLVQLRVNDVALVGHVLTRTSVVKQ